LSPKVYRGGKMMEGMEKINRKPIKITDTTFRDGHQFFFGDPDEDRVWVGAHAGESETQDLRRREKRG
jgi:hypothetical protein